MPDEHTYHILTCPHAEATKVWDTALEAFIKGLTRINTDSEFVSTITYDLHCWRHAKPYLFLYSISVELQPTFKHLRQINYDKFLEGLIPKELILHQECCYRAQENCLKTGKSWGKKVYISYSGNLPNQSGWDEINNSTKQIESMNYKDYPWFYNLSNQNTIWDYIAFLPANFLYSLPQPLTPYVKGPLIASVIGSLQSDWDAPFMKVVTSYMMSSPPMDPCDHGLVCHPQKTNNNSFPTSTPIQLQHYSTFNFSSTIQPNTIIVITFNHLALQHTTLHSTIYNTSNTSTPSSIPINPSTNSHKLHITFHWCNVYWDTSKFNNTSSNHTSLHLYIFGSMFLMSNFKVKQFKQ